MAERTLRRGRGEDGLAAFGIAAAVHGGAAKHLRVRAPLTDRRTIGSIGSRE